MRPDLPAGTVTFVFTDVEGSTKLLRALGPLAYAEALDEHRRRLRAAFAANGGVEVGTEGDSFFVAFPTADGALDAVREGMDALAGGPIRIRVGVHTGAALLTDEGYVGEDVHRAARIGAAGHGGQILVSASTAGLVDPERFDLHDLGEHRFKDLARPERVYQLSEGTFPSIRSLSPSNLPVPTTPFLGRRRELSTLVDLLSEPSVRLLTLTGPGGIGKTRLAIQAAAESSERFPGGLWWIPLAPLRDAGVALSEIAGSLGVDERSGRSPAGSIAQRLAGERTLLVLDNAEHLLPSLSTEIAPLTRAGDGAILVTSRERLHLEAEREIPVPAMAPRDAEGFFIARAGAVGVQLLRTGSVADLCRRLDHLPLAMQLAAARLKLFSVEQLVARLSDRLDLPGERDADPRQQTLRATIGWSHDLLGDEERSLFRRLSVFAGGATIDAIEAVCGEQLDVLLALVEKSLVRRRDDAPEPRFWMLETIREFAAERLAEAGELERLREAHAHWVLAHVERWDDEVRDAIDRRRLFELLDPELDNVRSALSWALEHDRGRVLQALAGSMGMYWQARGLYREGRRWLDLADRTEPASTTIRIRLLDALANVAYRQGDGERALEAAGEALPLARSEGSGREVLTASTNLANALTSHGRLDEAEALYDEALALARASHRPERLATALVNRGDHAIIAGRYEEAADLLSEGLEIARSHGISGPTTIALVDLATVSYQLGRDEEAAGYAVECIAAGPDVVDLESIVLMILAGVHTRRGDRIGAGALLGASEALREASGYAFEPAEQALEARVLQELGGALDEPDVADARRRGRALSVEDARALVFEG